MKRREFITLLGGAAAWPLAAHAQQGERTRRIAIIMPAAADDPVWQARLGAFLQGLALLGWTIGRNAHIDIRWGTPNISELRRQVGEMAALAPDVILAGGASTMGPLIEAVRTVPIVFTLGNDPVGSGYVDSLARPGGNITGFMSYEFSIAGKWLELLKEIAPGVTRVAVLRDASQAFATSLFAAMQAVAPSLGVEVIPVNLRMRRREFIVALGGAAVAWPLVAHAQQRQPARIGFLRAAAPPEQTLAALRSGLSDQDYHEGKNVPPTLLARADEVIE